MIHQGNDKSFKVLIQTLKRQPAAAGLSKQASLGQGELEELPKTAYAWEEARMFPIHSKDDAVVSYLYILENEDRDEDVPSHVKEATEKALRLYGVSPEDLHFQEEKVASGADTESDSNYFLLPQKQRWNIKTAEHLDHAEQALVERRSELGVAERTKAARLFIKKAEEHSKPVSTSVLKLAGRVASDLHEVVGWLDARANLAPEHTGSFQKIAESLQAVPPLCYDSDSLFKLAATLEKLDSSLGLDKYYGSRLLDPIETVFNTDKKAEQTIDLGGVQVPLSHLARVPEERLKDIFGEELVEEAVGSSGELDIDVLAELIDTMPRDLKLVLARSIG